MYTRPNQEISHDNNLFDLYGYILSSPEITDSPNSSPPLIETFLIEPMRAPLSPRSSTLKALSPKRAVRLNEKDQHPLKDKIQRTGRSLFPSRLPSSLSENALHQGVTLPKLEGTSSSSSVSSLPMPDFTDVQPVLSRRGPPPTPMKPNHRQPAFDQQAQLFVSILEKLNIARLPFRGQEYSVSKIEGAKGDFMQAFMIDEDPRSLFPNVEVGVQLLVKTYLSSVIQKNSGFKLESYMSNSLNQYDQAIQWGLRVARILNYSSNEPSQTIQDRVLIVEYIPHAFEELSLSWFGDMKLEDIKPKNFELLQQAKIMFNKYVESGISFDLLPRNLRYDDKGLLYLIDFRETSGTSAIAFIPNLTQALAICSRRNPHVFKFLTSDFRSLNLEIAQKVEKSFEDGILTL